MSAQLLDLNLQSSDVSPVLLDLLVSLIKNTSESLNFLGELLKISQLQRTLVQISVESVDLLILLGYYRIESLAFDSQHSKFF